MKVKCRIRGVAPLLQHRFPEESDDVQIKKRTGSIDYSTEVEKAIFKNEDGVIYEPSEHIEGCLRKAASSFRIPGQGKKTYKDMMLSSIVVEPEMIPLEPQEYEVDKRSVIIGRARVFRYRPRWDNWELDFNVNILDEQLTPDSLKEILIYGGAAKGIGDYRPKFGRFEVTEFKEVV